MADAFTPLLQRWVLGRVRTVHVRVSVRPTDLIPKSKVLAVIVVEHGVMIVDAPRS